MATERFNHKYTHCSGDKCEFRSDCIHFLAYMEAIELQLENFPVQPRCEDLETGYVRVRIEPPDKKNSDSTQ